MTETSDPDRVSPSRSVLFLSSDLIFSSRVKGAAARADLACRVSGKLPDEGIPDDELAGIEFVIIDLSTKSSLAGEIMAACSQRCPQATVIAYAPHVQTGKITAAREAGIPTVLTRGQFDSKLSTLFGHGSLRKSPS